MEILVSVGDFNGVVITIAYEMRVGDEPIFTGTSEHVFLDRSGWFVRMKKVMPAFCEAVSRQLSSRPAESSSPQLDSHLCI